MKYTRQQTCSTEARHTFSHTRLTLHTAGALDLSWRAARCKHKSRQKARRFRDTGIVGTGTSYRTPSCLEDAMLILCVAVRQMIRLYLRKRSQSERVATLHEASPRRNPQRVRRALLLEAGFSRSCKYQREIRPGHGVKTKCLS